MGYYIDPMMKYLPTKGKARYLIEKMGATEIKGVPKFQPNLVCVVEGPAFDAAGFAFTELEMNRFDYREYDSRPRRWLVVPDAARLSGYEGDPYEHFKESTGVRDDIDS